MTTSSTNNASSKQQKPAAPSPQSSTMSDSFETCPECGTFALLIADGCASKWLCGKCTTWMSIQCVECEERLGFTPKDTCDHAIVAMMLCETCFVQHAEMSPDDVPALEHLANDLDLVLLPPK